MKRYLLGIDIGTQGTKAALVDERLNVISTAFEPSKLKSPVPGTVWQEPDDLYGSCMRTIKAVIAQSGVSPHSVCGIGVDSQMAGIMGVDEHGEASTYYDSWLDTRSSNYILQMEAQAGKDILKSSGGPVSCNHATKILWWKQRMPQAYHATSKFVLPHGYVVGKMTGSTAENATFDYTCLHFNSFSDNEAKGWNQDLLRLFEVSPEKMPRVVAPTEVMGGVTPECAAACDLISGIPVVAGLGDSAASTFGCGMVQPGSVLDCAGTASILCGVVDRYVPDTENRTMVMMRSPVDGLWLPLSYISGGGLCIRWVKEQLSGTPAMTYEALEHEACGVPAGSDGLLFCPHFAGRVLPPEPDKKGAYFGLNFKHTRAHLYRAAMEGIACEYANYLKILQKNFGELQFSKINTVGGGSQSDLFNQIKADVMGTRVETFETGETALIGSAAVAGMGVGLVTDAATCIQRTLKLGRVYLPNEQKHTAYAAVCSGYNAMLKML